MLVEIDEYVVERDVLEKAKAGDTDSRKQIVDELNGMELYMHALTHQGYKDPVVLTLRDLEGMNLVKLVTVHAE